MASDTIRRVKRLEAAAEVMTDAEVHAALVQYGDEVFAAGPDAPGADPMFEALISRFCERRAESGSRADCWAAARADFVRRGEFLDVL